MLYLYYIMFWNILVLLNIIKFIGDCQPLIVQIHISDDHIKLYRTLTLNFVQKNLQQKNISTKMSCGDNRKTPLAISVRSLLLKSVCLLF